jgi:hypothetical protein
MAIGEKLQGCLDAGNKSSE